MGIPESRILEVKESADIVEIISAVLPLKRAGQSFKARCPFHEERTPSFTVSPERQTFRCFGCGAGGDVYTFLMQYEKVEFPDAVRSLAERMGIRIEEEQGPDQEGYRFVDLASRFFQRCLQDERLGRPARDYLERRGIARETVERFEIGYAPSGGRALVELARKKSLSLDAMVQAGLLASRDGGHRDRFWSRLMFPIADLRGRTVGFGGRVLGDGEPKYLNSPEGPLFQKSQLLYGSHLAKESIRKDRRSVVVEGYTDAVLAHQKGITSAVASLGTAFTPGQAHLLGRLARDVVLVYDPDTAGAAASERGLDVLLGRGLQVRIATLPEGKDPFDFLAEQGPEAFLRLLDGAEDFLDYKLRVARGRHDLATATGEAAAAREVVETLDKVPDPIEREVLFQRAARTLGISEETLRAAAPSARPGRAGRAGRAGRRPTGDRPPGTDAPDPAAPAEGREGDAGSRSLEEGLIEILLGRPDLAGHVVDGVGLEVFGGDYRPVAEALYEQHRSEGAIDASSILVRLREQRFSKIIVEAQERTHPDKDYERWWSDVQQRLRLREIDEHLHRLKSQLKGARGRGDTSESNRIFEEYASRLRERDRIRG